MLKRFCPTSEKSKFLLIITLAFVAIIGLGFHFVSSQMYKNIIDSQKNIVQANYNLVTTIFESEIKSARALATAMALNPENARAVANKDTLALKALTLSKFLYLKKKIQPVAVSIPPAAGHLTFQSA